MGIKALNGVFAVLNLFLGLSNIAFYIWGQHHTFSLVIGIFCLLVGTMNGLIYFSTDY